MLLPASSQAARPAALHISNEHKIKRLILIIFQPHELQFFIEKFRIRHVADHDGCHRCVIEYQEEYQQLIHHGFERIGAADDQTAHHAGKLHEPHGLLAFDRRYHAGLYGGAERPLYGHLRFAAHGQDEFDGFIAALNFVLEFIQEQEGEYHAVADDHTADRNDLLGFPGDDSKA